MLQCMQLGIVYSFDWVNLLGLPLNNTGRCCFAATYILTSPVRGSRGSFIGFSSSGLPLYRFSGDALQKTSQSLMLVAKHGLKQILEDPNSKKIFYFLCINLVSNKHSEGFIPVKSPVSVWYPFYRYEMESPLFYGGFFVVFKIIPNYILFFPLSFLG